MNFRNALETLSFYLAAAFAGLTFLFAASLDAKNIEIGNDIEIFCRAGAALAEGKNPYLVSDLGGELSWNYPSILADGFRIACPLLDLERTYIPYYALFFLASLLPWIRNEDWVYGFVLCATGLFNLGWVVITGNISTLEFLLFSLAAFLLVKAGSLNGFMSLFGSMAGMKLIPLFYIPALYREVKRKPSALVWFAAGLLLLPLLSFVTSPGLFPWYIRQVLGLIPNQHTPLGETTISVLNPSLALMLVSLSGVAPSTSPFLQHAFSLLLYSAGVAAFFLLVKRLSASGQNGNIETVFSLGIVILTIVLPRSKPYNFLPCLLCFYLLSRRQSGFLKAAYLILLSIVPTFLHLIYFYTENSGALFEAALPAALAVPLQAILTFHQMVFLCVAAAVLINGILRGRETGAEQDPRQTVVL